MREKTQDISVEISKVCDRLLLSYPSDRSCNDILSNPIKQGNFCELSQLIREGYLPALRELENTPTPLDSLFHIALISAANYVLSERVLFGCMIGVSGLIATQRTPSRFHKFVWQLHPPCYKEMTRTQRGILAYAAVCEDINKMDFSHSRVDDHRFMVGLSDIMEAAIMSYVMVILARDRSW